MSPTQPVLWGKRCSPVIWFPSNLNNSREGCLLLWNWQKLFSINFSTYKLFGWYLCLAFSNWGSQRQLPYSRLSQNDLVSDSTTTFQMPIVFSMKLWTITPTGLLSVHMLLNYQKFTHFYRCEFLPFSFVNELHWRVIKLAIVKTQFF